LRHALQIIIKFDDTWNWVRKGKTIMAQIAAEDWRMLGYSSWSAWADSERPGGIARAQISNLRNYWLRIDPMISALPVLEEDGTPMTSEKGEALYYQPIQVISKLERSALEELVGLLSRDTLDARGVRVICDLILDGTLVTVADIRSLKTNPAFANATTTMDQLAAAGLKPEQVYRDLVESSPSDNAFEKLGLVAAYVVSDPGSDIEDFVDQMQQLSTERVRDYTSAPHGRSIEADDPQAREMSSALEHERPTLQVRPLGNGMVEVRGTWPVDLLSKLYRSSDIELVKDGKPVVLRNGKFSDSSTDF
jgi:hypothetical protein